MLGNDLWQSVAKYRAGCHVRPWSRVFSMTRAPGRGPYRRREQRCGCEDTFLRNTLMTEGLDTLKLSTRLSSWNRLLRSSWRLTGVTPTKGKNSITNEYSYFLKEASRLFSEPQLLLEFCLQSSAALLGSHLSWTATTSLVQKLTGHPGLCGLTDYWGSWNHRGSTWSSSESNKQTNMYLLPQRVRSPKYPHPCGEYRKPNSTNFSSARGLSWAWVQDSNLWYD